MIVVKQSDLGGMSLDVLRQVMALPAEELIVCITTLDNGDRIGTGVPPEGSIMEPQAAPPVPQNAVKERMTDMLDAVPVEGETAFPLRVIESRAVDSQSAGRVYTSQSPMAPPETPHNVSTLPAGSARFMKQGGAGGPDQDLAGQADDRPHRPPRLPEDGRGVTWTDLCAAAEAVRMTARMGIGGGVVLTCALGATAHTWASAIEVINARRDYATLGYVRATPDR